MLTSIILALSLLSAKADPMDTARKTYNNCMIEQHNAAVESKKSLKDFNDMAQQACPAEKQVYFDIIAKGERSFGSKPAEAAEYAAGEVQLVIDSITSAFSENAESGAKLTPEK